MAAGCANTTDCGTLEPRNDPGSAVESLRVWLDERCEDGRLSDDCGDWGARRVDDRIDERFDDDMAGLATAVVERMAVGELRV